MNKEHHYNIEITWTGNLGVGTRSYISYSRDYKIFAKDKPIILGSADPALRGNPVRHNPEEMLLAALASCHMLWYP